MTTDSKLIEQLAALVEVRKSGADGILIAEHRGTKNDIKFGTDYYRVMRADDKGDIEAVAVAHVFAEPNAAFITHAANTDFTALLKAFQDMKAENERLRGVVATASRRIRSASVVISANNGLDPNLLEEWAKEARQALGENND